RAVTLKLPEELLEQSGKFAQKLRLSRAEYMRRAIERMNQEMRAQARARRMAEASRRVRDESMRVNAEFAVIEHGPAPEWVTVRGSQAPLTRAHTCCETPTERPP